MFDVLLSIIISFTITFLAIPAIITVAETKKLFDVPDERKIHQLHIPSLGGLGIFAGFIMACLICIHFISAPEFPFFLAASIVMFFLGLKDDILIISPIKKFLGQVIAAFLIIAKGGVQIKSMHGFLGVYELPDMFGLLLTYFTVLVIINSFNLIDGIDGLAGSLGIMAATIFGIYFLKADLLPYSIMAFALAGSLAAFLIFNVSPARIFMGDTGSMIIGLVNAILVVKFINVAQSPEIKMPIYSSPAIGFIVLLIPLLDTLRVFAIRIFHRRSPFSPDRNHIHHLMLDKSMSHNTITLTLLSVNLACIVLAYIARPLGNTWLLLIAVCCFFAGIAALYYTRRKPRLFIAKSIRELHLSETKILPLKQEKILERKN